MHGLSARQRDIVAYIEQFNHEKGHAPSYREICSHLKLRSVGTVHKHIQAMRKKGVIKILPRQSRSVALNCETPPAKTHSSGATTLPLMGYVKAGYPVEMLPVPQHITVPSSMVNPDQTTYLLRARGESLHEELIADGDLILIEAREPCCEGETVLCVVNEHDTMIKRLYEEDSYMRFEGTSSRHYPILVKSSDVQILGVVTGLLRLYT